jgi:hypothetical protein
MLEIMATSFDSEASKITTVNDRTVACLFVAYALLANIWNTRDNLVTKLTDKQFFMLAIICKINNIGT